MSLKRAIETAMDSCIEEGILKDVLMRQKTEVMHMLLTEFDEKKYKRSVYQDGYEDGESAGFLKGKEAGLRKGEAQGRENALRDLARKKVSSTLQLPYPSILRGLGVTFCVFFPHNSLMNILQKIFTDHFEEMLYIQHPRDSVIENVEKMIHCGDPSFGGAMYACPSCRNFKFVPFRCHSRFCPSCGNMYAIDRTTSMSFKIINVQHRHCVFTIARELRPLFLSDRSLLNCLFSSVNSVVSRMFHKDNKSELFTPGFICVLHTFGRDLKWNPHIHCLVSEGGVGNSLRWRHKNTSTTNSCVTPFRPPF